jgi:aminomethyltransferase
MMLKRTPLYAAHQKLGARLVEFGGWEMPVQYTSIVDEHQAVRQAAGLFDICHMGELSVEGPHAAAFLNRVLTNDIEKLAVGQGQYTLLCNEQGGTVDDLYAYRIAPDRYLLVINASRIEADVAWLRRAHAEKAPPDGVVLRDRSDELGALAVQGPRVADFIVNCFPGPSTGGTQVADVTGLRKNQMASFSSPASPDPVLVARTGYTGEDGFELIAPAGATEALWQCVFEAGQPFGLKPAGLGARDTLRTEMGYPLYGHELDENTSPIEAGLGFFVSLEKGEFTGRAVLAAQKAGGVTKRCLAFKLTERAPPPRPGYPLWSTGDSAAAIGKVVSGTQSPSLGVGIGLGYAAPAFCQPGTLIAVEVRGKRSPAVVAPKPIYRRGEKPSPAA